jgi:hypothetical protein
MNLMSTDLKSEIKDASDVSNRLGNGQRTSDARRWEPIAKLPQCYPKETDSVPPQKPKQIKSFED